MTELEFVAKYGVLCAEMSEYWDGDTATGKEADDYNLAQRWLREDDSGLPLKYNIATLRTFIVEARDVLSHFDECAPYVQAELNLGRTNTPEKSRAWLEKMIPIWEEVLRQVEEKWRSEGGT